MELSPFLAACCDAPDVHLTHFLCVTPAGVAAQYAAPPYRMDTLRLCFSMTKSFASLAVGIAWDQGLLALDDFVGSVLPDCMPEDRRHPARRIRVRDLLTMSGGIGENTYDALFAEPDWVKAYLHQDFPHEPGSFYLYSTHGSHVLSALVERVSGLSLEDFLNRHLFHPMGIFEAQWERAPEGRTAGGMGLSLYPASLAKTAQMLLNRGVYGGKRLISARYLDMAAAVQIRKQDHDPEKQYGGDGYGFQFHIGRNGYFRMDGAFGQVCLICPDKALAFVALSAGSETESLLRLIYRYFLEDAPPYPAGVYRMAENPMHLHTLTLRPEGEGGVLELRAEDYTQTLRFRLNGETRGRTVFLKDLQMQAQDYVCRAVLQEDMELTVFYIETPYTAVYRLRFSENTVRFDFRINVSFTLRNFSAPGTKLTE
ncbi:MAG: serine hydrolase domain-containing protein [Hominenteromicrobium sp.]